MQSAQDHQLQAPGSSWQQGASFTPEGRAGSSLTLLAPKLERPQE